MDACPSRLHVKKSKMAMKRYVMIWQDENEKVKKEDRKRIIPVFRARYNDIRIKEEATSEAKGEMRMKKYPKELQRRHRKEPKLAIKAIHYHGLNKDYLRQLGQ